jgi:ThiF family
VSARLRAGIVVAERVPGVHRIGTPRLTERGNAWDLPVWLDIGAEAASASSPQIPQVTPWIVTIDRAYPLGSITVYPAADGITGTYPHQDPNREGRHGKRTGKLCLDSPYGWRSMARPGNDPLGDADERLAWHLARAREWLLGAARNELVRPGDPFEVPRSISIESFRVVHDESPSTFAAWRDHTRSFGQVWFRATSVPDTIVASRFATRDRVQIRASDLYRDDKPLSIPGVWWLWPAPIVVPPWRAALTWQDLRDAGELQGVNVLAALQAIVPALRVPGRALLMLGYPIPRISGGADQEVHWEVLRLPELTKAPPRGFRPTQRALWRWERERVFPDAGPLPYVDTESWHPDRLQARGRLPERVRTRRIAIIGCGALGSMIAELLARAGVRHLTLIDGDILVAGNLVRHVLTASSLDDAKSDALAARLRQISPVLQVESHAGTLPAEVPELVRLLEDADVVLDCTATHEVPALLAAAYWSIPKRFLSVSFGFGARRLFAFRSLGSRFAAVAFAASVEPWLGRERALWAASGETFEGAGCYAPLFPARMDDVMGGAVAAVKLLEDTITNDCNDTELVVLQGGPYGSFRRIWEIEEVEDVGGEP